LGVPKTATAAEIRKAYTKLAREVRSVVTKTIAHWTVVVEKAICFRFPGVPGGFYALDPFTSAIVLEV
jgi:hypothetical protein